MQTGFSGSTLLLDHRLVSSVSHPEQTKGIPFLIKRAAPSTLAGSFFAPVKRLPRRPPPPAGDTVGVDTAGVGDAATGSGSATSSLAEPGAPRVAPTATRSCSASARRSLAAAAAAALAARVARSFSRSFLHGSRDSSIHCVWLVCHSACGGRSK